MLKPTHNLGYYTVGNRVTESKIEACVLGTKQNIHPEWQFDNHVWNNAAWHIEPDLSILQLYEMRAKQIREQYDYVIINYSGGSDSQTVVDAFLKAGCHIDEIVTIWNRKHTKDIWLNQSVTDARNIEAEFDLTTKPGLEAIKNASPTTKITYLDISDAVVEKFTQFDGEEWLSATNEHLHPQFVTRYCATREKDQLTNLDKGLKTAVVFGTDKPRITIKDGKYYVYFIDTIVNSHKAPSNRPEYTNLDHVLFYWSAECPDIVIKQAHMIRRWFDSNPALKPLIAWPNHDYSKRQAYEYIARSIVYPGWDIGKFQCVKTSNSVYSEWDNWFFQEFKGTTLYQNWHKGVQYVETHVDKKFLNYTIDNEFNGFIGFINGHFCINP